MKSKLSIVFQILFILILMGLISINIYVLSSIEDTLLLPERISEGEIIRQGVYTLIASYEKLADESGLGKTAPIRDNLAKFKFEVDQAVTSDEIVHVLNYYGRNIKAVLDRERENRLRESLVQFLLESSDIKEVRDTATIVISNEEDSDFTVSDPLEVLSLELRQDIKGMVTASNFTGVIEIEINNGNASLLIPRTLGDKLKFYQNEIENVRSSLHDMRRMSGFGQLSGPGIIVHLYDAEESFVKEQVIDDNDVRDIINELYSAGATGIEVGGERLIATSSIKMVDEDMLINGRRVQSNPVIIKAVGDSEILLSSLELIRNSLEPWGITFHIESTNNLLLVAYKSSGG